jgi:hypothetical protein
METRRLVHMDTKMSAQPQNGTLTALGFRSLEVENRWFSGDEQGQPCDMSALSLKLHISDLLPSFVTGAGQPMCMCTTLQSNSSLARPFSSTQMVLKKEKKEENPLK